MCDASQVVYASYVLSSLPAVHYSSVISWATTFPSVFKTALLIVSVASFVPITASGTTEETSCAKNPSCTILSESAIQLNLAGFNCFNRVVASKS